MSSASELLEGAADGMKMGLFFWLLGTVTIILGLIVSFVVGVF